MSSFVPESFLEVQANIRPCKLKLSGEGPSFDTIVLFRWTTSGIGFGGWRLMESDSVDMVFYGFLQVFSVRRCIAFQSEMQFSLDPQRGLQNRCAFGLHFMT